MNIIIFSTKKRNIGDCIKLGARNGNNSEGVIVGKCEDNPKYQNQKVCGHNEPVNSGKDYYIMEIKE